MCVGIWLPVLTHVSLTSPNTRTQGDKSTFSNTSGAVSCDKCSNYFGTAYTSGTGALSCNKCRDNYYMDNHGTCLSCESMIMDAIYESEVIPECNEGSTLASVRMKKNYFRFSQDSKAIYSCYAGDMPDNCRGNTTHAGCSRGSTGPLCAVCEKGFFPDTFEGECVDCAKGGSDYLMNLIIIVVSVVTFGILIYTLATYCSEKTDQEEVGCQTPKNRKATHCVNPSSY